MQEDHLEEGKVVFANTLFSRLKSKKVVLASVATLVVLSVLLGQFSSLFPTTGKASKVQFYSSYYKRYDDTSKQIGKEHYQDALTAAKKLKNDLETDTQFWEKKDKLVKSGTTLYAYNLIRIAALERALGSKEGELNAWNDLVAHAGWEGNPKDPHTYDPEAYALIAEHFSQDNVSLRQFIQERKKILQD